MRLIDADALMKRLKEDPLYPFVERYNIDGFINAEPTVDAVPVRHGRWGRAYLDHVAMGERPSVFYCSVCGQCIAYPVNYCPNCGARMDGKDGDGNG